MLHDPGSYTQPQKLQAINLTTDEEDILKGLVDEYARIAALPVQKEKAALWTKLNDRDSERPMVWINEIPWHEMNIDDELTIRCSDPWAQGLEQTLRREIYQWKHMPGDMVVSEFLPCPLIIHSTDFGIHENVDVTKTDEKSDIVSRHFNIQIKEPEDLEKITMPVVTYDEASTNIAFDTMRHLFKDIIEVRKIGQKHIWFTPWDYLIRWWGIQEAMMDLVMRPRMVHDAVERMVRAWMTELDQLEEQNLLSLDCNNTRVGSGGYGYTSELPGDGYDPNHVRSKNMWGCSNAQIFSEVSPEMHWEFAVEHDMKWLNRWGLTYYGCCEPLDRKIDLMCRIPNLRKLSVSPWNNFRRIVEEVGGNYVLSVKPNPAVFAEKSWNSENARQDLQEKLEIARATSSETGGTTGTEVGNSVAGCHIEFIMKDISTVKYKPERLWEWETIAMEVVTSV